MLANETAEKPRVKPSQGSSERVAQPAPAQPPAPDALPPELMGDELYRAAAERSAPWQVRHASRIRIAALIGITGGLAGLSLYGWNTLRPSELDKLQITLPARTSAGFVEPAAVPPPPAVVPTAIIPTKVQPATPPQTASVPPKVIVPTKVQPAPPSGNRTPVTHTRRGDASTPAAAAVAAPAAAPSQAKAAPKSN